MYIYVAIKIIQISHNLWILEQILIIKATLIILNQQWLRMTYQTFAITDCTGWTESPYPLLG